MEEDMFKFPLPDRWQEKHKPAVEIAAYYPTGVFVSSLRKALGITQETFCCYLNYACSPKNPLNPGYAVRTVSRWERGKSHPSYWLEEQMLKGFAWQVWSLRGDTEEQMSLKGSAWQTSRFLNIRKGASL